MNRKLEVELLIGEKQISALLIPHRQFRNDIEHSQLSRSLKRTVELALALGGVVLPSLVSKRRHELALGAIGLGIAASVAVGVAYINVNIGDIDQFVQQAYRDYAPVSR